MRLIYSTISALIMMMAFGVANAVAIDDGRLDRQLLKLDPTTRLEQTCDTEVMLSINRSEKIFNVDKVIAYTFEDTIMGQNAIKAPGAAFRSRGSWYQLSYNCITGPKHLNAHKLNYNIGAKIPQSLWEDLQLYD